MLANEGICTMVRLKDHTLGLLLVGHVDVADKEDPGKRQGHDTCSGSKHSRLTVAVRLLNDQSLGATRLVAQLGLNIGINHLQVLHGGLRQVLHELLLEGVGPNGTGNRVADGTARSTDDKEQRERSSNVLMVDGSQNGNLLGDNEDGSSNGRENLTHDQIADALIGSTEMNHQSLGKDIEGNGKPQQPLEIPRPSDAVTDKEQE